VGLRHSPCETYIKYLIIEGHNNATIKMMLQTVDLDYLTDTYTDRLRRDLQDVPSGFNPRSRTHIPSLRYIVQHGVMDLFHTTPDVGRAFDLLESARCKEFVESSFAGGAPVRAIIHELCGRFNYPDITVSALLKYHQFFWNMNLLDTSGVKAIIYMRFSRDSEGSGDVKFAGDALKKQLYSDSRWVAASLPHTPYSAMVSQIAAGFMPANLDLQVLMAQTEMMLQIRLFEEVAARRPEFDRRIMNITIALRNVQELQQSKSKPEDALRNKLEQIKMRVDTNALPLAHSISGGHHTADIAAMPSAKDSNNERK
jgi:hypothetical protein